MLNLKQIPEIREWDRSYRFPFSMSTSVKTGCSVWTTEGSPNGIVASLGKAWTIFYLPVSFCFVLGLLCACVHLTLQLQMHNSICKGGALLAIYGSCHFWLGPAGMNTGAARVEVERCVLSWLYRSSSACLSQQFDKTVTMLLWLPMLARGVMNEHRG